MRTRTLNMFLFSACCVVFAMIVSGCVSLDYQEYDPLTAQNVQSTIDYELADYELTKSLTQRSRERTTLKLLHESEMKRLEVWLDYEKAKRIIEDE